MITKLKSFLGNIFQNSEKYPVSNNKIKDFKNNVLNTWTIIRTIAVEKFKKNKAWLTANLLNIYQPKLSLRTSRLITIPLTKIKINYNFNGIRLTTY